MIDRFKAMREKLEEHGKIKPDDELSNKEIQKMYMKYQFEFMRAAAKKSKPPKKKKKAAPAKTDQLPKSKEIKKPISEILGKQRQEFESKLKKFQDLRVQFHKLENMSAQLPEPVIKGMLSKIETISEEMSELVLTEMEE